MISYEFLGEQFDSLYNFASNSGWRFIFDLNLMLRNGTGWTEATIHNSRWNSTNAKTLFDYASSKGYEMDWELGNGRFNHYDIARFICNFLGKLFRRDFFRSRLIDYGESNVALSSFVRLKKFLRTCLSRKHVCIINCLITKTCRLAEKIAYKTNYFEQLNTKQ